MSRTANPILWLPVDLSAPNVRRPSFCIYRVDTVATEKILTRILHFGVVN